MESITNFDIFEEMFRRIQGGMSLKMCIKEYGGDKLYIPSYKKLYRDEDIIRDYYSGMSYNDLARKYDLSSSQIYKITKETRMNDP